ncbi:hypothetical protein ACJMK2_040155 [Sinanodonta woodiana]|uniref:Uncharacterized protein n=1 Tax=Sinanodonta woodiana TaxID=1069815 RepID=A0ABD3WEC4_SINWO
MSFAQPNSPGPTRGMPPLQPPGSSVMGVPIGQSKCNPRCTGFGEICAETSPVYCKPGNQCHVCIKMATIRFGPQEAQAAMAMIGARGGTQPIGVPPQEPPQQAQQRNGGLFGRNGLEQILALSVLGGGELGFGF